MLGRVPEFRERLADVWPAVIDFLCAGGWLHRDGGTLALGLKGESRFRGKRLADLCVSFDSPRTFSVLLGNKHLGDIDPLTLSTGRDGPRILALNGRSWRVTSVEWDRGQVYVEPAEERGRSQWISEARGASRALAQEVLRVLEQEDVLSDDLLTQRSRERHAELREELGHTLAARPLRRDDGSFDWWNYVGIASNILLAAKVHAAGGHCKAVDSFGIRVSISAEKLEAAGGWRGIEALEIEGLTFGTTPLKFADLLPEGLVARVLLKRTLAEAAR